MQVVMSVFSLTPSFTNLAQDPSLTSESFFALILLGSKLPKSEIFGSIETLAQILKRTLTLPILPGVDANCRKEDHDGHQDDAYRPANQCFDHRLHSHTR